MQFLVVCQSVIHLKALFKEEWEIYAGQAGCVLTIGPPNDRPSAEWMSKRAGMRSEARMSQNEGQGVTVQGISTSDGTTISQADVAFKTPEELMSIPVGTGRIWVPGRGNTSIPYYAPNYWKLKNLRGLIDKNPLYNGPITSPSSPSRSLRRHWKTGALFGAVAALVIASGVALYDLTGKAQSSPPPMVHQPAPPHIANPPRVPQPHHRR